MNIHQWRERAEQVREDYRARVAEVSADRDLSDEGRGRRLAQLHREAQTRLDKLSADEQREVGAHRAKLEEQLWGRRPPLVDAASHAISMRDADDRVSQLKTPDEASALMRTAERNGDAVLARAVFRRAIEHQSMGYRPQDEAWAEVGRDYYDRHAEVQATCGELAEIESLSVRQVFSPFAAQLPHGVPPMYVNEAAGRVSQPEPVGA